MAAPKTIFLKSDKNQEERKRWKKSKVTIIQFTSGPELIINFQGVIPSPQFFQSLHHPTFLGMPVAWWLCGHYDKVHEWVFQVRVVSWPAGFGVL